jgi:DNA adenine methylase
MTVRRPALRYFGGKWRIAPWIISHFPPHRIYCEPFGGAASVLLRKERSYAEVYNDRDGEVVNLFRVLRDRSADLGALLENTPTARDEYDLAHEPSDDPVEQARRTIIRSFLGFGAASLTRASKSGFRARVSSNRNPAADFHSYIGLLDQFRERLRGVIIENRDAIEVMEQQDGPDTLHFVDPPYVHGVRTAGKHGYRWEMTDADHERLCGFLQTLGGMVVLCGYDNPIYGGLGWGTSVKKTCADGGRERTEVLWMNPACLAAAEAVASTLI